MHVSLLHLNRLLEDDIPFKTELRVCLVEDEELAQVEFRNTLAHTGRKGLLCKFHLTLPSRKMPLAVSITYHFKLEHFICSNLLSVEKFWVSHLTEFSHQNLVPSHFQFAKCYYLNTVYVNNFVKAYSVD